MTTQADVQAAVQRVRERLRVDVPPTMGVVLGSGLGGLADRVESSRSVPYHEIPGFKTSTAGGHQGRLIYGTLGGVRILAMAGRFHRYEGWTRQAIAFPIEVMAGVGATHLIVSNAAGGVNPRFSVGDLVLISDHLDWLGTDAGASKVDGRGGSSSPPQPVELAFGSPSRTLTYDEPMMDWAKQSAIAAGFSMTTGTYLATLGPNYETRAEYRMMRRLGADMVGMSTVPEVLSAARLGMKVLGISMISNIANPDRPIVADHQEVLQAGRAAAAKMEGVVRGVLERLAESMQTAEPKT